MVVLKACFFIKYLRFLSPTHCHGPKHLTCLSLGHIHYTVIIFLISGLQKNKSPSPLCSVCQFPGCKFSHCESRLFSEKVLIVLGVWWKTTHCGGCVLAGGLQEPPRQETLILTGRKGGTSLNILTGDWKSGWSHVRSDKVVRYTHSVQSRFLLSHPVHWKKFSLWNASLQVI